MFSRHPFSRLTRFNSGLIKESSNMTYTMCAIVSFIVDSVSPIQIISCRIKILFWHKKLNKFTTAVTKIITL